MRELGTVCLALLLVLAGSAAAQQDTQSGSLQKQLCELCGTGVAGQGLCFEGRSCAAVQACDTDADCPAGEACIVDTCCDPPKDKSCGLLCDVPACLNPGGCGSFSSCEPLLVELESFEATFVDGQIVVSWTTIREVDNYGFRLLRARHDGSRVDKTDEPVDYSLSLLTPDMVAAAGSDISGASYKLTDTLRHRPGMKVLYYLEDVDLYGRASLHGPATVTIPEPVRRESPRGR